MSSFNVATSQATSPFKGHSRRRTATDLCHQTVNLGRKEDTASLPKAREGIAFYFFPSTRTFRRVWVLNSFLSSSLWGGICGYVTCAHMHVCIYKIRNEILGFPGGQSVPSIKSLQGIQASVAPNLPVST